MVTFKWLNNPRNVRVGSVWVHIEKWISSTSIDFITEDLNNKISFDVQLGRNEKDAEKNHAAYGFYVGS